MKHRKPNPTPVSYIHAVPADSSVEISTPMRAIIVYLVDSDHHPIWVGTVTVGDPTFIQGLMQGFVYHPSRMIALFQHMAGYYKQKLAQEAAILPIAV